MQKPSRQFSKQYTYKSLIGSGTFGTVKKCICNKTGQLCAVKTIDNVNGINIDKIQQQASIMKNANSDYSLELYDHFFDQNNATYILAMPYIKFGSLQKKLNEEWTLNNVLLFLYQITQAFLDFSQKQIMHLDLKPENILIKNPGQYLVCDFGCSKVIQDFAVSKNYLKLSYSKGLGTPEYAAPEIQKDGKANKYSDVWSLGVILYKIIYHKMPYPNKMGLLLGNSKATFASHKPQFQPLIPILKRMISQSDRPKWIQIKNKIYEILKIQNYVNVVTSTIQFSEYVKNLSVLGTCFLHHIQRVTQQLQSFNINYRKFLYAYFMFLQKLTQNPFNNQQYYFFQLTLNRLKGQDKERINRIFYQIKEINDRREIRLETKQNVTLNEYKDLILIEAKNLEREIMKLSAEKRKKLENTKQYEFFKVKKILEFINYQLKDNLSYNRKRELAELIRYLIYS